jgi:hypothetical protein
MMHHILQVADIVKFENFLCSNTLHKLCKFFFHKVVIVKTKIMAFAVRGTCRMQTNLSCIHINPLYMGPGLS